MTRRRKSVSRMLIIGVAVLDVGFGAVICWGQIGLWAAQTGTNVSFQHDGRQRDYRLHVPKTLPQNTPVPLVVSLHGGGTDSRIASAMGLSAVADREGFIVVYPNAIKKHWNDGRNSPMFAEQDKQVDDVDFIMKLLSRIREQHSIDDNRIFVTGLSNGGFMSQRLAMEQSETFAAVGIIIATMGEPLSGRFDPKLPVSVLYMNGTKDPTMPYNGGPVGVGLGKRLNQVEGNPEAPRGRAISTDQAVSLWVKRNQTKNAPVVSKLPDSNQEDGSQIEFHLWQGGQQGTAVALYKVIGGGHGIPGGRQYLPVRMIGKANQDAKGYDLVWDFFENHARQAAVK